MNQNLLKAYLNTDYVVFYDNKEIIFKINEISIEIEKLLKKENAVNFVFITAYNPKSIETSEKENILEQKKLKAELEQNNYKFFYGEGRDPQNLWKAEKSFFVLNLQNFYLKELIKKYKQNAVVIGSLNNKIELYLNSD